MSVANSRADALIAALNAPERDTRLDAVRRLKAMLDCGELEAVTPGDDVNNHVHTTYSFSPYSPSRAVWEAYRAGLKTVGIMDHDSVSGAREFIEAAGIIGILATVGVECRADMSGTSLSGRRFNNPDQEDVAYIALHGIPHQSIDRIAEFFLPLTAARQLRNRQMTDKLNSIISPLGISLDYAGDVVPLSQHENGGSVTERHLLFALSLKILRHFGRGAAVTELLEKGMGLTLSGKVRELLLDSGNECYEYDLLGALKSGLVERFYIPATDECPPVQEVVALARETGAISAYAYLGDVGDSVTGDKKPQTFEDAYLDELFVLLGELSFNAVTYMPSRNTPAQLERLRELCGRHRLFQISGEDINTPRQSFICYVQRQPEFANLYDAALALIGHERAAGKSPEDAMFSPQTIARFPDLDSRIAHYCAEFK